MKINTIKKVSELTGIPATTLSQWNVSKKPNDWRPNLISFLRTCDDEVLKEAFKNKNANLG